MDQSPRVIKRVPKTLEGRLGKDPEMRETQERLIEATYIDETAELEVKYEYTTRPRPYLVFDLAVSLSATETQWYHTKLWNADRMEYRNIRFLGKGDRVEVKGWLETISLGEGGRTYEQLIVQKLRRLARSSKRPAPEIP